MLGVLNRDEDRRLCSQKAQGDHSGHDASTALIKGMTWEGDAEEGGVERKVNVLGIHSNSHVTIDRANPC